ncbi:MAG: putative patatin/cPLA2 family phospholipase [Acidimicrobiales bacterium]|jgi:predicted patatin/cPLA2 family phospholipase
MIFEGNKSVIDAIKEKKRLMDVGEDHEHIKPLLIVDGGLMKGAYGVGASLFLEEAGFNQAFTNVVGISSGAPSAAYFLAGDVQKGSSLIYEVCCSRRFLNMWRFWNQVDTKYFVSVLKGSTGKGINIEKVFQNASNLYIGVADYKTGEPELLTPRNGEELLRTIQASILMPNVSSDIVTFNDIRYVDGGFTRPHILRKAVDEIDATHVLVITNQDQTVTTIPKLERFLNNTLFRWRMPKALRFAAHERRKERMKAVEEMKENNDQQYALIWGDHSIRSMERDSIKVQEVVQKSRLWWKELFEG